MSEREFLIWLEDQLLALRDEIAITGQLDAIIAMVQARRREVDKA